ncbi:ferritin family protein [Anaerosinus massiliensis]|uniref:ferritin family protein n=1 Tax=Massilibacillus massiliensis TaxID=1806837 RepID=UPI000DA64025|nr:ferritin family protein [Massilibacillus massiliensis]
MNCDIKAMLENTLEAKQEMVRDYQEFADHVHDEEIAKMFKHFAEGEALHAVKLKEALKRQ